MALFGELTVKTSNSQQFQDGPSYSGMRTFPVRIALRQARNGPKPVQKAFECSLLWWQAP
eukprot:1515561-Amphidinium_carterae.1